MGLYRKKPVVVEAITYEEFVGYGRDRTFDIDRGVPMSFEYKGYPITFKDGKGYLIPTLEGLMEFTPDDMLITGVNGEIYPCKIDIFEKTYEKFE